MKSPQILLTNDDGIQSPGLWTAAEALSDLGYVNLGTGITVSGTVGAALEAATHGIPALAISLETSRELHLTHSPEVDFSTAGYFAAYFGRLLVEKKLPEDVNVLKVDVPSDATSATPWEITRLSRIIYYQPTPPDRDSWNQPGIPSYRIVGDPSQDRTDSDVYAVRAKRVVSVTPLSLDLTSRIELDDFEEYLRGV